MEWRDTLLYPMPMWNILRLTIDFLLCPTCLPSPQLNTPTSKVFCAQKNMGFAVVIFFTIFSYWLCYGKFLGFELGSLYYRAEIEIKFTFKSFFWNRIWHMKSSFGGRALQEGVYGVWREDDTTWASCSCWFFVDEEHSNTVQKSQCKIYLKIGMTNSLC